MKIIIIKKGKVALRISPTFSSEIPWITKMEKPTGGVIWESLILIKLI
jgi:hypothetical protein